MRVESRGGAHAAIMTVSGNRRRYSSRGRGRAHGGIMPLREERRRMRAPNIPLPMLITAVAAVCVGLWVALSALPPRQDKADTAPGLAFLEAQELRDPAAVDAILRERAPQAPQAPEGEDWLEDGADVWGYFQDYVLLGDSRAVGYYYYDFLDTSRVLADGGNTIRDVEGHMEEIAALQPRYVYLCYGLNDVSIGYWDTPQEYVEELLQVVSSLEERLPGVKVVVSSILPARDPAFEMSSAWYNIPDFNVEIAAACGEKGVAFADNDAISETYGELWQPDGIHLNQEFYPHWAKNLLEAGWQDEE